MISGDDNNKAIISSTGLPSESERDTDSEWMTGGDSEGETDSGNGHPKYVWLHALYHLVVATIGTGILGYPFAMSFLGWAGGPIFLIAFSGYCYYTALLLIGLQGKGQGTYSEIADGVMGNTRFSKLTVVPAQYLYFFPIVATMILVGGTAMSTIDELVNGGRRRQTLSLEAWKAVDATFVFALSLKKDMSASWQISAFGSLAAFLDVGYSVAGSIVAITETANDDYDYDYDDEVVADDVQYDRPASERSTLLYKVELMAAFGQIMFGYGYHSILPDVQASLHDGSVRDSRRDMKKAVTGAMAIGASSYLVVALLGFAAFGVGVDPILLLDLKGLIPDAAAIAIWVFVAIKTSTEGAVFNQAAFTLTRDMLGLTKETGNRNRVDHHPKNRTLDVAIKFVWVGLAAVVAIYLPYFSDLTAITSAISVVLVAIHSF